MKHLAYLILAVLGMIMPHSMAQEPVLEAGHSFNLRLTGVPAEETAAVSQVYTISSEGKVKLPHLPTEITAAKLTPTQLQRRIEAAYKAAEIYTHPTVTINVNADAQIQQVITIGGEVRQPTEVPFRPGLNLYGAISRAGGPSEFADMRRVKLIRGNTEKIYDLRKVTTENNPELQAGDQVVVPGS